MTRDDRSPVFVAAMLGLPLVAWLSVAAWRYGVERPVARGVLKVAKLTPYDDFLIGTVISVRIHDEGHFAFGSDKYALPAGVTRRGERHTNRRTQRVVGPEQIGMIFQAITVSVAEEINLAFIAQRHEFAVRTVLHIIYVFQRERQLARSKTAHEHLHRWRIGETKENRGND